MIGRQEETIDLVKIIQSYMDGILEEVTGLKALIMDSDTLGIVSLVMSKTHTIREEVFLMEHISNIGKEPLTHLKGIYLLRPTMENKERLMEHLEEGIFSEFYIYFTNLIPEALIQELASVDKHCLVKQCQVYIIYIYIYIYIGNICRLPGIRFISIFPGHQINNIPLPPPRKMAKLR